jgi:hypothetical protein
VKEAAEAAAAAEEEEKASTDYTDSGITQIREEGSSRRRSDHRLQGSGLRRGGITRKLISGRDYKPMKKRRTAS